MDGIGLIMTMGLIYSYGFWENEFHKFWVDKMLLLGLKILQRI